MKKILSISIWKIYSFINIILFVANNLIDQFLAKKNVFLIHYWSDKVLKSAVVNRTIYM